MSKNSTALMINNRCYRYRCYVPTNYFGYLFNILYKFILHDSQYSIETILCAQAKTHVSVLFPCMFH